MWQRRTPMFDKLYDILKELELHKRDKNLVMMHCVKNRLHQSLISMEHDTEQSITYLYNRESLNMLKKLSRD